MPRPIYEIAEEIRKNWKNVSIHAEAYLGPMDALDSIHDKYYLDYADDIVLRFLCNAQGWRGDTARRVKKELKEMCKRTQS